MRSKKKFHKSWEYDKDEDKWYNSFSAFECTLQNFDLLKRTASIIDTLNYCKEHKMDGVKILNAAIKRLQDQIDEMQQIIDEQQEQIATFKTQISKEMDGLWSDVRDHDHRSEFRELSDRCDDIEGTLSDVDNSLHSSLETLQETIDDCRSDINKLADEQADMRLLT